MSRGQPDIVPPDMETAESQLALIFQPVIEILPAAPTSTDSARWCTHQQPPKPREI